MTLNPPPIQPLTPRLAMAPSPTQASRPKVSPHLRPDFDRSMEGGECGKGGLIKRGFFKGLMGRDLWTALPPLLGLFFLGMAAGCLLDLTGRLLRVWGRDAGMTPGQMDRLSLLEFLGPLRVVWAPLLTGSLPFWRAWQERRRLRSAVLGRMRVPLGRQFRGRRAWVVALMAAASLGLWGLGHSGFLSVSFQLVLLGLVIIFNSLDVLIVASQVDAASKSFWGLSESMCLNGYRVGLMVTTGVALFLSDLGASWTHIYTLMAGVLGLVGLVIWHCRLFDFLAPPESSAGETCHQTSSVHNSPVDSPPDQDVPGQELSRLSPPTPLWQKVWAPAWAWFRLPGSLWMVAVMLSFRWQDSLIDPQREYIMLAAGLTKTQLAGFKAMGIWISVVAALGSGALIRARGHGFMVQASLVIHGMMALLLAALAACQAPASLLGAGLLVEGATKSMALVAFYAFQMVCCQPGKVVAQLALVAALGDLGYHGLATRSGFIAQTWGWAPLFLVAGACALPALLCARRALNTPFIRQALASPRSGPTP